MNNYLPMCTVSVIQKGIDAPEAQGGFGHKNT